MSISLVLRRGLSIVCLVLLSLCLFLVYSTACYSYELLLGTGNRTTFSYFAGKRLCHSVNSNIKEVSCRVVAMEDHTSSLTNLVSGALDVALVNAKMIHDALNSEGMFRYLDINYENLRLLLPLYKEPVVLAVRQDAAISSLDDLAGKRVNGGPVFTMQNIAFQEIMKVKGWDEDIFNVYQTLSSQHAQDSIAFNAGDIQAMVHFGMHPDQKLEQELSRGHGRLIGIYDSSVENLIQQKSGFTSYVLDAGTYPEQSQKITTVAMETLLITSSDVDKDTLLLVLQSILEGREQLHRAHPALLQDELNMDMLSDRYVAPHPAAEELLGNN